MPAYSHQGGPGAFEDAMRRALDQSLDLSRSRVTDELCRRFGCTPEELDRMVKQVFAGGGRSPGAPLFGIDWGLTAGSSVLYVDPETGEGIEFGPMDDGVDLGGIRRLVRTERGVEVWEGPAPL